METTTRSEPLDNISPFPEKLAVVLGNEVAGIAPRTLQACDRVVEIPMAGVKNSINVAVAGAVVAFHAINVWRRDE